MVPFQLLIIISSPSARPYEQASKREKNIRQWIGIGHCRTLGDQNRTCTQALLALFQFLQKSEISWDFGSHIEHKMVGFEATDLTMIWNKCAMRDVATRGALRGRSTQQSRVIRLIAKA
jgi:hypothetical protein